MSRSYIFIHFKYQFNICVEINYSLMIFYKHSCKLAVQCISISIRRYKIIYTLKMVGLIRVIFFASCVFGLSKFDPFVETKQGLIRGLLSDNGQYVMYLGIPYAVVDEANPFGPSVPHTTFSGTFEAFDDSIVCPHLSPFDEKPLGSLDCLRLNVYVPRTVTPQDRLPVMVWLHAGGFIRLSGNREQFAPDFLVRHNVIVVSINFRLGIYGFLCLDHPIISGNQGLKDQLIALRWINENIQSFGGDPNRVTLFGESSGAKSITLNLVTDSEKLYDKVIIQSGTAVSPIRLTRPNNTIPLTIAEKLGYKTHNFEDALAFLARQNVHSLIKLSDDLGISVLSDTIPAETRPCMENKYEGAFITDYPFNLKANKVKDMPIMFGFNSQESLYRYGNADAEILSTYSFKDRIEAGLDLIDDEMVELVKNFYIGDSNVGMPVKEQILNFETDYYYYHPTIRTIRHYMNEGAKSVHLYAFFYEGGRNYMKILRNINGTGACHVDELGYIFISTVIPAKPNAEDQRMIDVMTTMWTNFAKYGDPTPEITDLLPVKWLPVNSTAQNCLKIDSQLSLLSRPFHERMAFWDLFYKLNGETQNRTENHHIY